MLFNSLEFVVFFPIVIATYFLLSVKYRRIFLLSASWYFYMAWKPEYIFLLAFSTTADFFIAKKIQKEKEQRKRKLYLFLSLFMNLAVLLGFKYFNFFTLNFSRVLSNFNIFYDSNFYQVLLPVGISFYTFQTMSYAIDVYKKRITSENNYVKFALFVSFFPQLVAGPIERASHLLPQFEKQYRFDYYRVTNGLKLIFWGFFQKIVIADNMARFTETLFSHPNNYSGIDILLATLFFSIQIYCDFSGYTDIARGTAQIMGYNLQPNFKRPYFAKSFADFWRRWHISLSTWFRDYVFIPLGGSRVSKSRLYLNIFITFVASGIWHGARWSFIIWGILHSIYYLAEMEFKARFIIKIPENKLKRRILEFVKTLFVFTLVNFAWIFFRSKSVTIAFTLIENIFKFNSFKISFHHPSVLINLLLIAFLCFVNLLERKKNIVALISSKPKFLRWTIYYVMIIIMLIFGNFNNQEFIYFQF